MPGRTVLGEGVVMRSVERRAAGLLDAPEGCRLPYFTRQFMILLRVWRVFVQTLPVRRLVRLGFEASCPSIGMYRV